MTIHSPPPLFPILIFTHLREKIRQIREGMYGNKLATKGSLKNKGLGNPFSFYFSTKLLFR
jgi:hypothetical protein